MTAIPSEWVPMTFLVEAGKETSILERHGKIQELMGRGGDGTYTPAIRIIHARASGAAPAGGTGVPTVPVRLEVPSAMAAALVAQVQNAAVAASLARIEGELAAVNQRLDAMQSGLDRLDAKIGAALRTLWNEPVAALRAARTSAAVAFRRGDHVTLAAAAREAEAAAHRLIGSVAAMAEQTTAPSGEGPGLPLAFQAPAECAELLEHAGSALLAAGAIYAALDAPDVFATLARDGAKRMHLLRRRLKAALTDSALLPRRLEDTMAGDAEVIAMGRRLVAAIRRTEDGAGAIALGLTIGADGWFALGGIPVLALHLSEVDTPQAHPEAPVMVLTVVSNSEPGPEATL